MLLDVGQHGFASAVDAAQVQSGIQVVRHNPAVRVLNALGQSVDVVQDAGNVSGDFIGSLACPVSLAASAVLQCVDGDIVIRRKDTDDFCLLVAVPDQVVHLDIIDPAGGFGADSVQRLHNAQNGVPAACAQLLHVVTIAVTDVDNFGTMGSAFHINTGQIRSVVRDDGSEADRLIGVVLDVACTLIRIACLGEQLQAGQLRELLVVCLGLDVRQLLGKEDARVVRTIVTKRSARERVPIGAVNQRGALRLQSDAVLLAVTVCGVERIEFRHRFLPP